MKISEISRIIHRNWKHGVSEYFFESNSEINRLLTDSRNLFNPGDTLFVAINTPGGNDGHKYISELYDKGIRNFIVEYLPVSLQDKKDVNIIKVPDTVRALSLLGQSKRQLAKKIVAITGSRGKTSVKEMIFQLLRHDRNISRSPRSYNSKIGVPLSLWEIEPDTDLGVIEAGISKRGEMANLVDIISPDVVIFTNIGEAHSDGFASWKEKGEEKALLASSENVQTIIYPQDDKVLQEALAPYLGAKNKIAWSEKDPDADLFIRVEAKEERGVRISYTFKSVRQSLFIPVTNEHDFTNAISSLALMLEEGVSSEDIAESFSRLSPVATRLNVSEGVNGCTLILDSYTSDYSSLLPAMDFMRRRKTPAQEMVLILSDLLHETEDYEESLRQMSSILKEAGIKKFIGIGPVLEAHRSLFPEGAEFYRTTDDFLSQFSAAHFVDEIILMKGAPEFRFSEIFREMEARNHETVLEVNLDAMLRNYNYFRSKVNSTTGIIAMVKAFGYGVGSYEIAKTLQDAGASYLAVAVVDEGVDLRRKGITMPVMIMNPRSVNKRVLFSHNLEPAVYSFSLLFSLIEEASSRGLKDYPVNIKLDTGMHRMGFLPGDIRQLTDILASTDVIRVKTVFSHLATADCTDMDSFTLQQLSKFEEMSSRISEHLSYPIKRHILNSAGILRFPQYQYDLVRLGIGLYGVNTLDETIEKRLSVVATLSTVIICIREIGEGESVGYGGTATVSRRSRIATLPVGYADGIDRRLGRGALQVVINGKKAPTVGNICMDAMMVDVTEIDCKEGDSVEIFGKDSAIESLADTLATIPYEILTSVSPRVKRIYYRE